jgi:hypothetical protein
VQSQKETGNNRAAEIFSSNVENSYFFFKTRPFGKRAFDFPDKEDVAMRRWLALVVALGAMFLCVSSSLSAEGIVITGIIGDWKEVKARVPETAYLQLVKYGKKMKGNTDEQGLSAFDSKLPKIKVHDDGSFKVTIKELPEGKYFFALQRALPKEMSGDSMVSAIPILVTEKGPLMIQVPGTFPINVGKVFVAVRSQKEPSESPASEKAKKEPAPPTPEKE